MAAELVQYDDPLDPRGWVLEPTRRRLALAFPDLEWTVRPAGMVESWEDYDGAEVEGGRAGMAAACARMSEQYGMPIDEYLWFDDPPTSSWPACRAIAAAGLQAAGDGDAVDGPEAAARLLRACREATFARRASLSDPARLREVVEAVPGVDSDALWAAVGDGRADDAFDAAREDAAGEDAPGVERAAGRCALPTLVVRDGGEALGVSGIGDFEDYTDAVTTVTGRAPRESTPDVGAVLDRFSPEGWLARVELAHLTGQPVEDTEAAAAALVEAGDVVEETFAAEPWWRLAEYEPTAASEDDT